MLRLSVVTPEGAAPDLLDREVDELMVPGLLGELGILPGHIPLVSAVKAGVLTYRRGADRGKVVVGPGFVEVDGEGGVDVMVQRALPAGKVDFTEAERQAREAEERLKKASDDASRLSAQADLDWAAARLAAR